MTSNRVSTLLQWCDSQRIRIDPRLRILEDKNGLGVYAADSYIENPATLVYIPKSAVLSVRSCSLSAHIDPVLYGTGATLALALAVHGELLIGAASHWFAYLQSLPHTRVDIAVFWGADAEHEQGLENNAGDEEVEDGREAKAWIKGTQVERELGFGSVLDEIRRYYTTTVEPLTRRLSLASSLEGFYYAYSLVSSRAFIVDAYHGLAMVPIADAFNHSQDNHVHLETDYDVCGTCGSLSECAHDSEDSNASSVKRENWTAVEEDTCEMVCDGPILPFTEVFNTYGDRLPNAVLLARYGFSLDGNEVDVITWDLLELLRVREASDRNVTDTAVGGAKQPIIEMLKEVMSGLDDGEEWWTKSNMVYYAGDAAGCATSVDLSAGGRVQFQFRLNEEAKISHHLWLFSALLNLNCSRASDGLVPVVRRLWNLQAALEEEAPDGQEDGQGRVIDQGCAEIGNTNDWENNASAVATVTGKHKDASSGNELRSPSRRAAATELVLSEETEVVALCTSSSAGPEADSLGAALSRISRTIVRLCEDKISGMRHSELSGEELGYLVDAIPPSMSRSRMAGMEALRERSVLESCVMGWKELGKGKALSFGSSDTGK